ncbi:Protein of unknown function [Cotesia congregata]|uniref:RNase H type-1 domain-containing protein n=1 Tax=Cotesia congregata TaxID=51543 RepID=A0A8J2ML54_COTCN|nr:Protein of unknown function [Cotesia congregata]
MFTNIAVHKRMIHPIPPWEFFEPLIDLHVYNNSFGKDLTTKQTYSNLTTEMYDKYNGYCKLYTDGSVKNGKKGCGIIHDDQTFMYHLPDFTNIFSCEVIAIKKAIDHIIENNIQKAIILTDSKSALDVISNTTNKDPRIIKIQSKLHQLNDRQYHTILAWLPFHQGLQGNEEVDLAAKKALTEGTLTTNEQATPDEFKKVVNAYIWAKWNGNWMSSDSLLHQVRANVWEIPPKSSNRKIQTIITRLRIGHTYITHNYLMSRETHTKCPKCNAPITVHHILAECPLNTAPIHQVQRPNGKIPRA